MKKTIIGNLKSSQSPLETKAYLVDLLSRFNNENAEIVLCLPYTSLALAQFMLKDTGIIIGAQNLIDDESGPLTGEITGKMLKECGVKYCIIGHSERRKKFREDNKSINAKIKSALKNGLEVVLCVGETATEERTARAETVLKEQLEVALKGLYENELENITIAYEPVWAIGTGKTPSAKQVEAKIKFIQKVIINEFSENGIDKIRVVYGGSVDSKVINQYKNVKGLNGFIIGEGCKDVMNFLQIVHTV